MVGRGHLRCRRPAEKRPGENGYLNTPTTKCVPAAGMDAPGPRRDRPERLVGPYGHSPKWGYLFAVARFWLVGFAAGNYYGKEGLTFAFDRLPYTVKYWS